MICCEVELLVEVNTVRLFVFHVILPSICAVTVDRLLLGKDKEEEAEVSNGDIVRCLENEEDDAGGCCTFDDERIEEL